MCQERLVRVPACRCGLYTTMAFTVDCKEGFGGLASWVAVDILYVGACGVLVGVIRDKQSDMWVVLSE